MNSSKKLKDVPQMDDTLLARFWEAHEPEEFEGWEKGNLDFKRPPKKLIQLRLGMGGSGCSRTRRCRGSR